MNLYKKRVKDKTSSRFFVMKIIDYFIWFNRIFLSARLFL